MIVATTTWDSADVLEPWLAHVKGLGAAKVIVIDYGSTDGTREILRSKRWSDLVQAHDIRSLQADTSNDLLAIAKAEHEGSWCLFCDPDEFLVTPSMSLEDLLPAEGDEVSIVSVPRRNMTGPRSEARSADSRLSTFEWLTLRIEGRSERTDEERFGQVELSSPWIFTAIPGKVSSRSIELTSSAPGMMRPEPRMAAPSSARDLYFFTFRFATSDDFA